jgi:hypothetical protein
VNYPEQSKEFLDIFVQEGEGSSNIQAVAEALREHLKGEGFTIDILRSVAKDFVERNGAIRYAGQALAGSLETQEMKQRRST